MRTNQVGLVRGHPPQAVSDGTHRAELRRVYPFRNAYGERVMFEFLLPGGSTVTHSAAPSRSPVGKLAETLHGILGRQPSEQDLAAPECVVGRVCTLVVRTACNRSGKRYQSVVAITP